MSLVALIVTILIVVGKTPPDNLTNVLQRLVQIVNAQDLSKIQVTYSLTHLSIFKYLTAKKR